MRAASRLFFLSLVVLALCGFSSKFSIEVVPQANGSLSFELRKNDPLHPEDRVELNSFLVAQRDKSGRWDYKNPVWAFEHRPGSGEPLSKVIYGEVPLGFTERVKALKLVSGMRYMAVGLSPGSGGSAEFVAR